MPFVPVPNVVMVEFRAILDGQHVENRIMVDVLTTPTPTIVEDVAILAYDWARDHYAPVLPTICTITEIVATDLTVVDGTQVTFSPAPLVGGVNLQAMPNEVTFCLSLRSTSRGRSARGRFFWLSLVANTLDTANTLQASTANGYVTLLSLLDTAISTAGWDWVIVSYRHNNAPRVGGPVLYSVAQIIYTDRTVDSMRRRKPGVGA